MNIPTLQPDEKIIYESAPSDNLKKYWYVSTMLTAFVFGLIPAIPLSIGVGVSIFGESSESIPVIMFISFIILFLFCSVIFIISSIVINNSFSNRYYWVTNKRVIYRRGTFGYQISSIPMNRISDVILSRTFLENLTGIESLKIQTLAGQMSTGRAGSEVDFSAIPNAENVQNLIFGEMKNTQI